VPTNAFLGVHTLALIGNPMRVSLVWTLNTSRMVDTSNGKMCFGAAVAKRC